MKSLQLTDDDTGYGSALICPVCKEPNLHHTSVHVWERDTEDSDKGRYTRADGASSAVYSSAPMEGNPSPRRNGMTIMFFCEHCHLPEPPYSNPAHQPPEYGLHIIQHKGATYAQWDSSIKGASHA